MSSRFAYNVGGLMFTLDEIEHGVLRCNRGHPSKGQGTKYYIGSWFALVKPQISKEIVGSNAFFK